MRKRALLIAAAVLITACGGDQVVASESTAAQPQFLTTTVGTTTEPASTSEAPTTTIYAFSSTNWTEEEHKDYLRALVLQMGLGGHLYELHDDLFVDIRYGIEVARRTHEALDALPTDRVCEELATVVTEVADKMGVDLTDADAVARLISVQLVADEHYGDNRYQQALETCESQRPSAVDIDLDDFDVQLAVIESRCYNSAGATVTVEPELTIVGDTPPADYEARLVYEIHGGSAVEIFNMIITGTQYSVEEYRIDTESCDYELSVELIDLRERN